MTLSNRARTTRWTRGVEASWLKAKGKGKRLRAARSTIDFRLVIFGKETKGGSGEDTPGRDHLFNWRRDLAGADCRTRASIARVGGAGIDLVTRDPCERLQPASG